MNFEELYQTLAPKLTNYLVGNGSAYSDAVEIVQETFLRLWKIRDKLREDSSSVSALVFTIARNIRNDRARHGKFEVFSTVVVDGEEREVAPERSVAPAESLPDDRVYLRRRILQALATLPPVLREAYMLYQIGELSVSEAAAQIGITENLLKVRVHRAKLKLQPLLKDLL